MNANNQKKNKINIIIILSTDRKWHECRDLCTKWFFSITNLLTQQMLTIKDQVHELLVHFKSEHFEGDLSTLYLCVGSWIRPVLVSRHGTHLAPPDQQLLN